MHIENCTVHNSGARGIDISPTSSLNLFVRDTIIIDNLGGGILIKPTGAASVKAVLENIQLENNSVGMSVDGAGNSGGSIKVNVVDSVISGNTAQGVFASSSAGGAPVDVTITDATITGNRHAGILAQAAAGSGRGSVIVRFGDSNISNNAAGVLPYSQGVVRSLGGNFVDAKRDRREWTFHDHQPGIRGPAAPAPSDVFRCPTCAVAFEDISVKP